MSKKELKQDLDDLREPNGGVTADQPVEQNPTGMTMADLAQKNGELTIANANLVSDLQRLRADFENYRKRSELNLTSARRSGEQKFAKKILPLLDTFDAVFVNLTDEVRETDLGKGLVLAEKNLAKTLTEMSLVKLPVKVGDNFDHETMEAVVAEGDGEKVSAILRAGYRYDDQILRPAMVKVS